MNSSGIERVIRYFAAFSLVRWLICLGYTLYALPRNLINRVRFLAETTGPLVSVVIPVGRFDRAHEMMMRSIMRQTYRNLEVLEIDDTKHEGAGKARNRGLLQAKGKYVIFLDADDFFEPSFIAQLVTAAEKNDAEIAMCFSDRYEGNWRLFSPMNWMFVKEPLFTPTIWVKLFRRDFLELNGLKFQEIPRSNDVFLSYAASAKAKKSVVIRRVLAHYRHGQTGNLQSSNHLSPTSFLKALEALKPYLKERYESVERTILKHNIAVNRGIERLEVIRHFRRARVDFRGDKREIGGGSAYIRRKILELDVEDTPVDCDLIHINHLRDLVKSVFNPFRDKRVPIVFVVHGIHLRKFDFLPRSFVNRVKRFLRLGLERYLYRRVDQIIALNDSDAKMLKELYKAKCRILVEPNRVSEPKPDSGRVPTHFFIMLARFDFPKGQDILLKAIAEVSSAMRAKNRRVLFIGDGPLLPTMKELAARLGIEDIVEFFGAVAQGENELWRGKCLVQPSRWEGSPYAVLEAMARKMPMVLSDAVGNYDVAKDYEKAMFFKNCDIRELSQLLISDGLR